MPQIVPVSDFRSDITSVSRYTDSGEVVVLTQNGRPRWAMIDYEEWNAASRERERAYAKAIAQTQQAEEQGDLSYISREEYLEHIARRRKPTASQTA